MGVSFAVIYEYSSNYNSGNIEDGLCYGGYSQFGTTVAGNDPDLDIDCCKAVGGSWFGLKDYYISGVGNPPIRVACCGDDTDDNGCYSNSHSCYNSVIYSELRNTYACAVYGGHWFVSEAWLNSNNDPYACACGGGTWTLTAGAAFTPGTSTNCCRGFPNMADTTELVGTPTSTLCGAFMLQYSFIKDTSIAGSCAAPTWTPGGTCINDDSCRKGYCVGYTYYYESCSSTKTCTSSSGSIIKGLCGVTCTTDAQCNEGATGDYINIAYCDTSDYICKFKKDSCAPYYSGCSGGSGETNVKLDCYWGDGGFCNRNDWIHSGTSGTGNDKCKDDDCGARGSGDDGSGVAYCYSGRKNVNGGTDGCECKQEKCVDKYHCTPGTYVSLLGAYLCWPADFDQYTTECWSDW